MRAIDSHLAIQQRRPAVQHSSKIWVVYAQSLLHDVNSSKVIRARLRILALDQCGQGMRISVVTGVIL